MKKTRMRNPRRQPTREEVKATVRDQLLQNVEKGQDRATRSIELLGKMKEHDFFVRSADVQIGVFAGLLSDQPDPETDQLAADARALEAEEKARAAAPKEQGDDLSPAD